jgi:hypothetical protein
MALKETARTDIKAQMQVARAVCFTGTDAEGTSAKQQRDFAVLRCGANAFWHLLSHINVLFSNCVALTRLFFEIEMSGQGPGAKSKG